MGVGSCGGNNSLFVTANQIFFREIFLWVGGCVLWVNVVVVVGGWCGAWKNGKRGMNGLGMEF